MKRLTKRTVAGTANIEYKGCLFQNGTEDYVAKSARRQLAIDRLASYEDTGLEPQEIEQLKGEVFGLRVDKQNLEQVKRDFDGLCEYIDSEGFLRKQFCENGNPDLEPCICPSLQEHPGYIDSDDCEGCDHFCNSWRGGGVT